MLLRAMDMCTHAITDPQATALQKYLDTDSDCNIEDILEDWERSAVRWSRLHLPNGQVARSAWKECIKPLENVRMARNVKVSHFTDVRTNINFELV